MHTEFLEGQGEGTDSQTYGKNFQNIADLAYQARYNFSNWEGAESGVVIEAVDFKNIWL